MKVNLFALTGFGNRILEKLLEYGVRVNCLYTRREKAHFPYYAEEQIDVYAKRMGIPIVFVPLTGHWSVEKPADINLVATFHRILTQEQLKSGRESLNIHPSLLPSYRGPTPTNWIMHNQEAQCGITVHKITMFVDEGAIIYQQSYRVEVGTDSELRQFLAIKAIECLRIIINEFPHWKEIKSPYASSYYPSFYHIGE